MKQLVKSHWLTILVGLFVLINIILVAFNIIKSREIKNEYSGLAEARESLVRERHLLEARMNPSNPNMGSNFYGMSCPEATLLSISGGRIELRDLAGNVIIIRFSRFYRQDLTNLVYLEHLAGKYQDQGVSLIFVNSLGRHDREAIDRIVTLSNPIIEDDGSIRGLFNALPEDLIIIDRNHTIRFKYNRASKAVLYNEVLKWMSPNRTQPESIQTVELEKLLQRLSYYDVFSGEKHTIGQFSQPAILLTLFTSICTGCEESYRVQLIKDLAKDKDSEKVKILMLFGKGNNADAIKDHSEMNEWDESSISVGVVEDLGGGTSSDYYRIFELDVDPRTFIIGKNKKILFAENLRNSKRVNQQYIESFLK